MTVFIHIGPHKTATTAFQSFLQTHRRQLRGHYPDCRTGQNHHGLAWGLLKDGWRRAEHSRMPIVAQPATFLAEALTDAGHRMDTLLLSSEEFSRLDADEVRSLIEMLAGHDVVAIAVQRDFDDVLSSTVSERARDGYTLSSRADIDDLLSEPALRLSEVVDMWQRHCPVVLLPFDGDQPLLGRLASSIGQDHLADEAATWRRENERWAPVETRLAMLFHARMKSETHVFQDQELSAIVRHAVRPMLIWGAEEKLLELLEAEEPSVPARWSSLIDERATRERVAARVLTGGGSRFASAPPNPHRSLAGPKMECAVTVDGADYERRIAAEVRNYELALEQGGLVNSLPPAFTYWASTHVAPRMEAVFGRRDIAEVFASELIENSRSSAREPYRVLSVGSGDCRTEVEVAALLERAGVSFTFVCLEVNEAVAKEADRICHEAGMGHRFEQHVVDLNREFPAVEFDAAMANHSLHHIVDLEVVLSGVRAGLPQDGVFVVNDMIGRNGHMRWPEALPFVEQVWNSLPLTKRFNFHAKCVEDWPFVNYDCSAAGDFEGVRAQDILPLLLHTFEFSKFLSFGNVVDVFVDRAYGRNFDPELATDRAFLDYLDALNSHLIDIGVIKPTMMLGSLKRSSNGCTYDRWSPEFSLRRPDAAGLLHEG